MTSSRFNTGTSVRCFGAALTTICTGTPALEAVCRARIHVAAKSTSAAIIKSRFSICSLQQYSCSWMLRKLERCQNQLRNIVQVLRQNGRRRLKERPRAIGIDGQSAVGDEEDTDLSLRLESGKRRSWRTADIRQKCVRILCEPHA